jgi:N-acetylmuramoyl-L-alanine amidase
VNSQRSNLYRAVLVACAAAMAGCGSPPQNPYFASSETTPVITATEHAPEVVSVPDVAPPALGLDLVEPISPALTNHAAPTPSPPVAAPPPRWGPGWVPLGKFAAECGIGAPQRIVFANNSRYSIPTRNGAFVLTVGSQLARWNGVNVWLGFPVQVMHGQPCVHSLDAEKTLQPLSEPAVISAPGKTIVLDPGHGGADSGTRGARGEREKDFTLDWALRTERLLTNAGWRVVLTRRTDADIPLNERVEIADRAHGDLFISLHFNSAAPHSGPSGIETYYLTPAGEPSTLSRGYSDDVRVAFPNNAFDRANTQFAAKLHRELLNETHALDGGIRHARFMGVLRTQNRPAILIEGGYLSNPAEMSQIASARYRQTLAEAIAAGLK